MMLEQLSSSWWILILIGLVAGVLSGMLGIGSGIVLVPVLVTFFLVPQKSAQGTALAVMVPMALLGAVRYWHNPEVSISLGLVALLIVGSLAGTLIGTELAARLPVHWLRKAFALFLIIAAVRMLITSPPRGPAGPIADASTTVRATSNADIPQQKGSSR
jgi:hypothetical protein